jgi:AAA domain, putative AbiEii toxin, Type IV TA system
MALNSGIASTIEDNVELLTRQNRLDLMKAVLKHKPDFNSAQAVNAAAQTLVNDIGPHLGDRYSGMSQKDKSKLQAEFRLACALICTVALIDPDKLTELARAIRTGLDGHVSGLIRNINKDLEKALNFPRWWVQDRAFSLRTDAREHELVFMIRDRTEQDYSFGERSSGLKYFLSYYVQYLAHKPASSNGEILLMDEPDAYLSSQAQQDLLKIFHAFAHPEEADKKPVQVIYVTHSPFLIDRNHSDRIRVLEKGSGEEGTRVVRNVSRNHYEPLRSALGAFVAETTFIGNCNLMVYDCIKSRKS